jgi:hypothetical protein
MLDRWKGLGGRFNAVEKLFAICRASSGLQIGGIGDLQPGESGTFRPAAASAKSAPLVPTTSGRSEF